MGTNNNGNNELNNRNNELNNSNSERNDTRARKNGHLEKKIVIVLVNSILLA